MLSNSWYIHDFSHILQGYFHWHWGNQIAPVPVKATLKDMGFTNMSWVHILWDILYLVPRGDTGASSNNSRRITVINGINGYQHITYKSWNKIVDAILYIVKIKRIELYSPCSKSSDLNKILNGQNVFYNKHKFMDIQWNQTQEN